MPKVWEEQIALNVTTDRTPTAVGAPRDYARRDGIQKRLMTIREEAEGFLDHDRWPLPDTADREGYYGADHFSYWLSGAKDYLSCMEVVKREGVQLSACLDLGAATARVSRHFAAQNAGLEVYCADINLNHINWVNTFLGPRIIGFQNHSIPTLPFEDRSFDLVTAFSVFSHIEAFDQAWILEVRRILKPGGLFIFTANVDNWKDVNSTWPAYRGVSKHPSFKENWVGQPQDTEKRVFRWHGDGSYSSIVFLTEEYVNKFWRPIMPVVELQPYFTQYQTGVVLRKTA